MRKNTLEYETKCRVALLCIMILILCGFIYYNFSKNQETKNETEEQIIKVEKVYKNNSATFIEENF